jgi:hypothetical protein
MDTGRMVERYRRFYVRGREAASLAGGAGRVTVGWHGAAPPELPAARRGGAAARLACARRRCWR